MDGLKQPVDIKKLSSVEHSVRSAQAVLQYGVGAMVDFPDQTLMTAAPEYWASKTIHIHDERLEKLLGVDYFGMPGNREDNKYDWGIAYARFPQWYFCPKCRRFQSLKNWHLEYTRKATQKQKDADPYMRKPKCLECKKDLVPTRIVVACKQGHIDDFPWERWVHDRNIGGSKPICSNPQLTFETGATASAGLEGLVIRCKYCKARATLERAFEKDAMEKMTQKFSNGYSCTGFMPWKNKKVTCTEYPRVMQRGASSIYFPKMVSSLVIPPYSDKVNSLVAQSDQYKKVLNYVHECDEDEREEKILSRIDRWATEIGREIFTDANTIKHILNRRLLEKSNSDQTTDLNENSMKYKFEEYEALTGKILNKDLNGNDFVREATDIKKYDIPYLKSVALIHKIREVRALTGFTRINPPSSLNTADNIQGFVPVKEPETNWYPAYEVRGEGIFIEFDNNYIEAWLKKSYDITKRVETLNENYNSSYQGSITKRNIVPQFILLHTIAHLLIRQLSFECGYTAASLRERIYCSDDNDDFEMSGILIYTASGDSEGTLGGLIRQGYWDCFSTIFKKAMEYGEMCSNDPVCILSEGQGRDALNLAACHACVLLPETSCEEYNVFLDRGLVVGTFENKDIGFFNEWLSSEVSTK